GTFSPALPPLFINGVTASGQLGTPYTFGFDGNQNFLPIQDQASRSTYFVWNFRQACATQPSPARLSAELVAPLQVRVLGNPVSDAVTVEVSGAEGRSLSLQLIRATGVIVEQRQIERAGTAEQHRFDVHTEAAGLL